ncbi:MAG: hypothetical protein ACYCOU_19505 [Sulfobacillus sp.]
MNRARAWSAQGLSLLMGITALYIAIHHIDSSTLNVPFADTWNFLPSLGHMLAHGWTLGDLIAPYNGMRVPGVWLSLLLSASLNHLNVQNIKFVGVAFLFLTSVLLYFSLLNTKALETWKLGILFIPIFFLVLSLSQWETLLQEDTINSTMVTFFAASSLIACWSSVRRNNFLPGYIGTIVLCTLASYSFVNGLLLWPLTTALYVVAGWHKNRRIAFLIYLFTGLLVWSTYFAGNSLGSYLAFDLSHLAQTASYFLVSIGNSVLGFYRNQALVFADALLGIMLLTIYAFCTWLCIVQRRLESVPYVALIFYSLLTSAVMAYGRAHFGVAEAASSRYYTLTVLGPAGAFLSLAAGRPQPSLRGISKFALGALTAIIVLGVVTSDVQESRMAPYRMVNYQQMRAVLTNHEPITIAVDQLFDVYPVSPTVMREGLRTLIENRLSLFSATATKP